MIKKFLALLATAALLSLGAGTAQAAGPHPHNVLHKKIHFACSVSGYTYAVDQYWTINQPGTTQDPTNFSLGHEDEGTSPDFHANRVEFVYEPSTPDQVLYAHGGRSDTLDDVPITITAAHPGLFNTSDTSFNTVPQDSWTQIERQHMNVWGVGSGSTTASCTDNTPTTTDF